MIWGAPYWFLALLLVPLLVWQRYGRRRHTALRFSDGRGLRHLPPSWALRARPLLPLLYGLACTLLVIALARPQHGIDERRIDREAIDLALILDVSTSMLAEDFFIDGQRVNRMEVTRQAARDFIRKRTDDRIALVAFAGAPYAVAPLTFDQGWLLQQISRVEIAMVEDGTAIGSAIASGLNRLRDSEAENKVMVLLTDGMNNAGTISPENAARAAAALGIRIHTIGAGTQTYAPYPMRDPFTGGVRYRNVLAEFDEDQLRQIATITGGHYFHADDTEALQQIYDQIDELERTKIEVTEYARREERFQPFLFWALGLLAVEQLLALARLGRWP
jgi:Ca-activated chloride channel homolog